MGKQVDASHYDLRRYVEKGQWNSFYHQIVEVCLSAPASVLEIGVGAGVLRHFVKTMGIGYESVDIDPELHPDHVGSLPELPFPDGAYDTVACFEVLEHLPYEMFERSLNELFRIARKAVLLSLPDSGPTLRIFIPVLDKGKALNLPRLDPPEHTFDGEHYWEINKRGYPQKKINKTIRNAGSRAGFALEKHFRVFEKPYHHFYILKKP